MTVINLKKPRDSITIAADDADRLLALPDPGALRLYIYLLRRGEGHTPESAMRDLRMTAAGLESAKAALVSLGLASPADPDSPPRPDERRPVRRSEVRRYTDAEIASAIKSDPKMSGLMSFAESAFGHTLSLSETKLVLELVSDMELPHECVALLLNHCLNCARENGNGSLQPRRVRTEGENWRRLGIVTLEKAEQYIKNHLKTEENIQSYCKALGITRPFGDDINRLRRWSDYGFSAEAAVLARRLCGDGGEMLSSIDRQLCVWRKQGLISPRDILGRESRLRQPKPAAKAVSANSEIAAKAKAYLQKEGEL